MQMSLAPNARPARALLISVCVWLGWPVASNAAPLPVPFEGTLTIELGTFSPLIATTSGIATLSGRGPHGANALQLEVFLQVSGATPATDPILTTWLVNSVELSATLGHGTFAPITFGPITGGQALTQLPAVDGRVTFCILASCQGVSFPFSLAPSQASGFGVGVGGGQAVNGGIFGIWGIAAAPWRLGPATLSTALAPSVFQTVMRSGFVHGATSAATSAVPLNGALSLVAPTQIVVLDQGATREVTKLALFSSLTIHFLPEPNGLLLLGAGAIGLAVLGHRRLARCGGSK
jgi:hypothetical protein